MICTMHVAPFIEQLWFDEVSLECIKFEKKKIVGHVGNK